MSERGIRELIAEFDPEQPIESAWMPPSEWYTDSAIYKLEHEAIFSASWQPVARVSQLAEKGAYVAGCFMGEPWVVVRDHEGSLRAFSNTCRHKGREVAIGSGTAEALECGYHGWVYDLNGTLRSAPRIAGIKDFDREKMSLPSLAVAEWGPWVFLDLSGRAPALASTLDELDRRLRESQWHKLAFAGEKRWVIDCNWKVYVDNYLDGGYHIPSQHPSLDQQIDMKSYRTEVFGVYSIQSVAPRQGLPPSGSTQSTPALDYDPAQRIGSQALYAWMFPNFMINRYGPCLDSNYVVPRGPHQCEVIYEFYFEHGSIDDRQRFAEASIAQADVTQREDIAICESVQRGLASTSYRRGRYAPRVEVGEFHFHRLLQQRLWATL